MSDLEIRREDMKLPNRQIKLRLDRFFLVHRFCRTMLCISAAYAIMQYLLVTFVYSDETNKYILNIFSPSDSHTTLVFPHQTLWQYSNGQPPNWGVERRWGGNNYKH